MWYLNVVYFILKCFNFFKSCFYERLILANQNLILILLNLFLCNLKLMLKQTKLENQNILDHQIFFRCLRTILVFYIDEVFLGM
jgi:hypothetical protein